jgi:hypothetical protein
MTNSIGELVERFVELDSNWYLDTYNAYIEVGIENKGNFEEFIQELKNRNISYEIQSVAFDEEHIVHIYR